MSAYERYGLDRLAGPDPLGDDLPPPERMPCYGPFYPPEETVTCCPYCGLEVRGFAVADCDTIDGCREHGIVEGITIEVPWEVYERGPEAVLAYQEVSHA